MDPEKVQAVQNWEKPKCVRDLQYFLGFANFYQRFIEGYSCICQPMFNLLKKEKEWNWNEDCQRVFDQLKESFCTAPILKHFDPTLETILETDASDYVVSGILSLRRPGRTKSPKVKKRLCYICSCTNLNTIAAARLS